MDNGALLNQAIEATRNARQIAGNRKGGQWEFMGYVGAALITDRGNVFTGINLNFYCGIGFCAEHSAVAEMVKSGETKIKAIVASTAEGAILPPCGRCRELLYQVDESNLDSEVMVSRDESLRLRALLPNNWQKYFDKLL